MLIRNQNYFAGITSAKARTNRQNMNCQKDTVSFRSKSLSPDLEKACKLYTRDYLESLKQTPLFLMRSDVRENILVEKLNSTYSDGRLHTKALLRAMNELMPEEYDTITNSFLKEHEKNLQVIDYLTEIVNEVKQEKIN